MTPRETADAIAWKIAAAQARGVNIDAMIRKDIETAITTAIEQEQERERCAKVAGHLQWGRKGTQIAAAIRDQS